MAVNTYMKLGDIKGESLDDKHNDWIETATVQAGESNIGQVANRLGINGDDLLLANRQIKNPSRLNVGQEINLPLRSIPKSEAEAAQHETSQGKELPPPPLGDPLNASMTKTKLDTLSTQSAKTAPPRTQRSKK